MKFFTTDKAALILGAITAVLGFIAFMVFVLVLWGAFSLFGIAMDFWAMTAALANAVTVAGLAFAAVVAYHELNEISSSRHIEVANRLFEVLNNEESIRARRWIFQNLPADPYEGLTMMGEEGRDAVKHTLNTLDHVSFLTQPGWIPEEKVMPWMSPMVIKSWEKLRPYVEYQRVQRHEPEYYRLAQQVAERCIKWRAYNQPHAAEPVVWVDKDVSL